MISPVAGCALCTGGDAPAIWHDGKVRVVGAGEPDYPGFLRVIWRAHVREMTDLEPEDREHCLRVVWAVERVLRDMLQPEKINLASLGNQVPHLHWHVIPRFPDDAHFPDPVWAARRRAGSRHPFDPGQCRTRLTGLLGG